MTRLWTGKGDDGTSGLYFGGREPKTSARFEAVGAVDEAQAFVGLARAEAREAGGHEDLDEILTAIARDLWVLNAELATADDNRHKLEAGTTAVSPEMLAGLEAMVTDVATRFELPQEFVVPGQDRGSALLDVARTVVRRAERRCVTAVQEGWLATGAGGSEVVAYLNRLADLVYTLARWVEGAPLRSREA